MSEIWVDIEDYKGHYQVSNYGNVRSLKTGVILSPQTNNKGYMYVNLSKGKCRKFLVHRLVAIHFIPNPENLPEVNHKDGNKKRNRKDNLEWSNRHFNMQHAHDNHLIKGRLGGIVPIYQYEKSGQLIKKWDAIKDASRGLSISDADIVKCAKFRRKTAGGYVWRYELCGL
jgi:hypothetical protein